MPQPKRQPLAYIPVQPTLVVEVQVDAAFDEEAGRWRHRAGFVRVRADLSVYDVTQAAGAVGSRIRLFVRR